MQSFTLPTWVNSWLETTGRDLIASASGDQGYMRMGIALAKENFMQGAEDEQGGPFAAAVIHKPTGEILSLGINRVVPLHTSTAHAEMVALARAQQTLGQFSLRQENHLDEDDRPYTLYTSAQMCAMCLGAVCWSGVGEVVYGAKAEDTEKLTGFDEGPIHPHWKEELEKRGIKVTGPVLAQEANAVLKAYKDQSHIIYTG